MPFAKGQSGNPGGRVGVPADVRELARAHTVSALETLASVMLSDEAPSAARVAAANAILDRGYGKPAQSVTGENGEGPVALNLLVEFVRGRKPKE
jgi:hypothetical protein